MTAVPTCGRHGDPSFYRGNGTITNGTSVL